MLRSQRLDEATDLLALARERLRRSELPLEDADSFARVVIQAHLELAGLDDSAIQAANLSLLWEGGLGSPAFQLLLDYLEFCALSDAVFERLLTRLRERLLREATAQKPPGDDEAIIEFASALAIQAFRSEYVLAEAADEADMVARQQSEISAMLAGGAAPPHFNVAVLAAYRPLMGLADAARIRASVNPAAGSRLDGLIRVQIDEPQRELALRPHIRALTQIADDTSRAVRDQYEQNPYPRWHRLPGGAPSGKSANTGAEAGKPSPPDRRPSILIAGCGTGQHPIQAARKKPDVQFLAVDLSRSSIAYALRKAEEYGVCNVEFAQADLLGLPECGLRFEEISCVGVLHHLRRPVEGLRALRQLMAREHGLKVAVYTESGRQAVVAAIRLREERGIPATVEGIRALRSVIETLPASHPARPLLKFGDYYSASGFRDLAFHVMEHRYTIPAFAALASDAGLHVEKVVAPELVLRRFRARFKGADAVSDAAKWGVFEAENPGVFGSMYRFLLARKSP